jgi:hypothetical protein
VVAVSNQAMLSICQATKGELAGQAWLGPKPQGCASIVLQRWRADLELHVTVPESYVSAWCFEVNSYLPSWDECGL